MPDDESGVETQFVAAMTMGYSDLHEASLCFELAAKLGYVPAAPTTLRMIRTDLEKTRRLLHTCLTHIDTIERSALDLDEDEPDWITTSRYTGIRAFWPPMPKRPRMPGNIALGGLPGARAKARRWWSGRRSTSACSWTRGRWWMWTPAAPVCSSSPSTSRTSV